jgi:hypothetical protein
MLIYCKFGLVLFDVKTKMKNLITLDQPRDGNTGGES